MSKTFTIFVAGCASGVDGVKIKLPAVVMATTLMCAPTLRAEDVGLGGAEALRKGPGDIGVDVVNEKVSVTEKPFEGMREIAAKLIETKAMCAIPDIEIAQRTMAETLKAFFSCAMSEEFELLMKTIVDAKNHKDLGVTQEEHEALKEVAKGLSNGKLPGWNVAITKERAHNSWITLGSSWDADALRGPETSIPGSGSVSYKWQPGFGGDAKFDLKSSPLSLSLTSGEANVAKWIPSAAKVCRTLNLRKNIFDAPLETFRMEIDAVGRGFGGQDPNVFKGQDPNVSNLKGFWNVKDAYSYKGSLDPFGDFLTKVDMLGSTEFIGLRCEAGRDMVNDLMTQLMDLRVAEHLFAKMRDIAKSRYFIEKTKQKSLLRGPGAESMDFDVARVPVALNLKDGCAATPGDSFLLLADRFCSAKGALERALSELTKQQCDALSAGTCNTKQGQFPAMIANLKLNGSPDGLFVV